MLYRIDFSFFEIMSHIGKKIINIPNDVYITYDNNNIIITGKYGSLQQELFKEINFLIKNNQILLTKKIDTKLAAKFYGLQRTLIQNMILGVSIKFSKVLILEGIGYKFHIEKPFLVLNVGFTNPSKFLITSDITIDLESSTKIVISSINKEHLGLFAASIRAIRPPEPYKGKGILYANEIIKRKVGKKGK